MEDIPLEFKRYCEILTRYHQSSVGVNDYTLKVVFERKGSDFGKDFDTYADVTVNDVYRFAKLRFAASVLAFWEKKDFEEIAKIVLHELLHVALEPMAKWTTLYCSTQEKTIIREQCETVVELVARAFHRRLPPGYFAPEHLDEWARRNDIALNFERPPIFND